MDYDWTKLLAAVSEVFSVQEFISSREWGQLEVGG